MMNEYTSKTACPIEQAVLLFKSVYGHHPIVLAFSGGMDSTVLLDALVKQGLTPKMVHVHHGLQAVADDWVLHAQQQAVHYGVECHIERIELADKPRRGMEDLARSARYRALWQQVPNQGVLLTAHHQRDQAETLLLRLLRGAGVKGLGGIHAEQSFDHQRCLYRPLLPVSYEAMLDYAQRNQLSWVEDPTNQQAVALRNQIRHGLLPIMRELQPAFEQKITQTALHCQEADALLMEMAAEDWQKLHLSEQSWSLSLWQSLSWPRARQALAYRLTMLGESVTVAQWQQVKQQFYQRVSSQTHPELCLSQHKLVLGDDKGYCLPLSWLVAPAEQVLNLTPQARQLVWVPWLSLALSIKQGNLTVKIKPRQGGEKVSVDGKMRSLKSWLQKAHVPHWQMALWPVVYHEQGQLLGWPGMPSHWWHESIECQVIVPSC
ncbi:MAG: tRNA lysidine(34) synthetase TilS [Gammaproteobacteria bacterium]|nr:tRNA lysidine(34) synthetase TilS [Gammaproteobacteria bacterium]